MNACGKPFNRTDAARWRGQWSSNPKDALSQFQRLAAVKSQWTAPEAVWEHPERDDQAFDVDLHAW
jgi:hypothetical protein